MNNKKLMAVIYTLIAASMWGTIGLFVNILTSYGLNSIQLTVMRLAISTIFIGVYIGLKDSKLYKIQCKHLGYFFTTGVLCILFFNICYAVTIKESSMATAAVLLYTSPIIVTLVSIPVFNETLTKRKCIAVIFSVLGCALVSGYLKSDHTVLSLKAFLWGMGAAGGYAMYSVIARVVLKIYSSITVLFYTFIFASAAGIIICRIDQVWFIVNNSKSVWIVLIISALLCSTIPYVLYTNALSFLEASNVSIIASVEPLIAALLGTFVFREVFTIYTLIGISCILCSILILNKSKKMAGY